ncbi:hypothetical protein [Lysinibacillus sp. JNUCC 51]|uniref:hypothetical protein n=1 Tax=Lysinibacillus sp. JNUCC-51 TaxID=2792479 RepID=UPI0019356438|nr:hypothetical protein JNUCC51_00455 [Lysinibacillus sp. JNUCC-51]
MTEKTVVQKVKEAISGIEIGYFDTAKGFIFDEYFKYFNDDDKETRKHALLLFTTMLGNWYSKSAVVFKPEIECLKYEDEIDTDFYDFESYLSSLLDCYQNIEKEFPYMFERIVRYLTLIEKDEGLSFEEWFPEINSDIFKELREKILIPNSNLVQECHEMKYLFREVGIKPFFTTDFFEE